MSSTKVKSLRFRNFWVLLMLFLVFNSNSLFSQVRISEKFVNTPLIESLDLLSKKYGVKLAYDNAVVSDVFVNVNLRRETVEGALKKLLSGAGLDVVKINDVYVLKKQPPKPVVEEKNNNVVGIVRDRISGESLPYASVRVLGAQTGTSTNTDGFFSIQQGVDDSISIRVSYIGFEPIEMKIAKVEFNFNPILVEMDRAQIALPDVKVYRDVPEFISVGNRPGEFVWNLKKVGQIPTISGIDVVAPLQMLPGVDGTVESLSGLNVRHSPSDKNLFIYDGFTIYHIDHFFGAFTSFNSKAIKDIRVIRGGFDSRWGGRASSVIEITGKTGNENRISVDVGGDQLSADIAIEGPIGKKLTFIVAARRSFTDFYRSDLYYNLFESARSDLLSANINVSAFSVDPSMPQFFYYDANAKLNFKPTDKDNISISGYKGTDDLNYLKLDASPFVVEDSHWGNQGAGLRWSRQWNSRFYHNLTIGASDFNLFYNHTDSTFRKKQFSTSRDTILKDYKVDNALSDITVNILGQLKLNKSNTLEGGFQGNIVDISSYESSVQSANRTTFIDTARSRDFYSETFTGWIQNTISIDNLKAFTFGFRATHHNLTSKVYFEPRVQLMFSPTEPLTMKFAAGLYNQYVNRLVQFGASYRNIWVASDGDRIPVVKSKHFMAGFTWKSSSNFLIDLEGYIKNTDDLAYMQSVVTRTSETKITLTTKTFFVDSRSLGIDLLLKKNWNNAEFWVAYSLSKAFNSSKNLNGGNEYFAIDDHFHELKVAGVINFGSWQFSANWIYGSPKPWDELVLTSTLQLSPDYEKNASRLKPYHRLDAGISYNHKFKFTDFQLGIKGFNLYNRNNILAKPYSLTDNPLQDYLQGDPIIQFNENYGLGFTPTLYVNLKF